MREIGHQSVSQSINKYTLQPFIHTGNYCSKPADAPDLCKLNKLPEDLFGKSSYHSAINKERPSENLVTSSSANGILVLGTVV